MYALKEHINTRKGGISIKISKRASIQYIAYTPHPIFSLTALSPIPTKHSTLIGQKNCDLMKAGFSVRSVEVCRFYHSAVQYNFQPSRPFFVYICSLAPFHPQAVSWKYRVSHILLYIVMSSLFHGYEKLQLLLFFLIFAVFAVVYKYLDYVNILAWEKISACHGRM